jgi:GTP-binding protein
MKKYDDFFLKNKPVFLYGAVDEKQIISNKLPEIAFIGKSNVGKSSLINAVTNSKIARTSKTPGRTRELNYFNIANKIILVDMPGYGFALATKDEIGKWQDMTYDYLSLSKNIKKLFLLIDSRRGVKANDFEFMQMLDELSINYMITLTKIDSNKREETESIVENIKREKVNHITMSDNVLCCSSLKGYGISDIRKEIADYL